MTNDSLIMANVAEMTLTEKRFKLKTSRLWSNPNETQIYLAFASVLG